MTRDSFDNNDLRQNYDDDITNQNLPTPNENKEDFPYDEEFSEPLTPTQDDFFKEDGSNEVYFQSRSVIGWISLIVSFIALFAMPIFLGAAGIVLGFIARNREAEWLGNIAIVLGVIAIISAMFIRPFM